MARESYTSSTLGGTDTHTGVESDLHHHPYTMKLKNMFSFCPPQDRPLLLSISGTPGLPSHLPISNLSPANPPILGQTYTEIVL